MKKVQNQLYKFDKKKSLLLIFCTMSHLYVCFNYNELPVRGGISDSSFSKLTFYADSLDSYLGNRM